MNTLSIPEIWFVCGSQHLYGPGPLQEVASNAEKVAAALDESEHVALPVRYKALVTTPAEVTKLMQEASGDEACAGLILWMHTFSPAKMWIRGLSALNKPFCHLHTQFNRELPWADIDMDFMNLNQAAHGDREAGFLHTRMRLERKVVVGHWSDPEVQERLGVWARAAHAWHDLQGAKFVRFGDNMRYVAVTEGDKVASELRFGFEVNTHGVGDLVEHVQATEESRVSSLISEYEDIYEISKDLRPGGERHEELRYGARLELGMRSFLEAGNYKGFTDTFEDLHGLRQLPGLATQRLMADGYGFGGEGDWKTAVLLRALKVMSQGLKGGTSFMEDYTYHLAPGDHKVLGSHMLEVCPSIASGVPSVEIHPLGIGGKEDPVRLVFDAPAGEAIHVSLVHLGNRFRLIVSEVEAVDFPDLPKLPVARAVWRCKPDFKTAIAAWIYSGGAHHTVYSYSLKTEFLEDFANLAGVELVVIDNDTKLRELKNELRQNDLTFALNQGLRL
ncbi:MAG: L-arabinose isomerase [Trueperaceae bacterium]|jgi:L-arabinose isomerase|nr:L-arabinose isomerase [Trueperaceae bacterium]|tara:strand:+ start:16091 stop:17599 length:1509 start_codon:yes stop_codon:yes gene_type:complete